MLNFSLAMLSLSLIPLFQSVVCVGVCVFCLCVFVTLIRILSIYICTTTKRILLTRDYLETRFSKQTTAHFRVARPLLQTTVDRRRPIITPALHLLLILILTLLLLLLILMMILLGMMIVTAANRTAGEKLLQLTAAATASFRLTCSAAACPIAALHFQLLAQLRVVVQIEVQVAADRGNGDGVRDGRGNRISQTSSYFGHRGRGRLGCRRLLLLLLQQRSAVGADVSRAWWTVGEMIDQQRRGRGRRRVVVLAVRRRRLLQQQLGCDWCRRCWQLVVVVQGRRRRKRTARGRGCRVELLWC